MELLEALNWRYATKKMNGESVLQEKVDAILEAAHLAPTSSGLQPFEIIVITNKEVKEKIKEIAYNQSQITDSSHLLIFAAWDDYTAERINNMFSYTVAQRGLPSDAMDDYKNRILSLYTARSADENFQHAARQAYISFGIAIAAAAELKVDATPMEGFDNAALDKLLGLNERGLKSVTLLPLGYRDESNDWLVNLKKVRKPRTEFVTEVA
ncbi:MAG TPA: NAD(P)H-dependent oxidoreductase [Pseudosphingobacterium sp.]|nr:NAD(P)H-dependent oxidoreductase [Pseudosphingobacterium sp.]